MVSTLSNYYVTDSSYPDSYFTDMYTLLAKGVAPHYLALQLNSLSASASVSGICNCTKDLLIRATL